VLIHAVDDGPARMDGEVVAVFHAHPDDEAFATAAATTGLTAAGAQVRLWVATGGELPEQSAAPHLDEEGARRKRAKRLDRSCQLLGIGRWAYLTEPGEWADSTDQARVLASAPTATVAAAVRRVINRWRPQIVLTVGPDGLTGHPDHVAMHDAVVAALELPGWKPRYAWGAVLLDTDVAAAGDAIDDRCDDGYRSGRVATVVGVPRSAVGQTIESPGSAIARQQALDVYQAGLGTLPLADLIERHGPGGSALRLRALFDVAGWESDHFVAL